MHAVAVPFVFLLLIGAVAISRLNGKIDIVPNTITEDLVFTPAERILFVNDYHRLRLGLQVNTRFDSETFLLFDNLRRLRVCEMSRYLATQSRRPGLA